MERPVIPGRSAEGAEGKGIQEPSALLDPLPSRSLPSGRPKAGPDGGPRMT
jgi:hypothetical protein